VGKLRLVETFLTLLAILAVGCVQDRALERFDHAPGAGGDAGTVEVMDSETMDSGAEKAEVLDLETEVVCLGDCGDKECGDDGCGGSCGSCPAPANLCMKAGCTAEYMCAESPWDGLACDDENSCTYLDKCTDGICLGQIKADHCFIDGACYQTGAVKPGNPCFECASASVPDSWSLVPDGYPCGPSAACLGGLCCTVACGGKECGDDGCGGSCGKCSEGYLCAPYDNGMVCAADCSQLCQGKECGPAGENNECECGGCAPGWACLDGQCVAISGTPKTFKHDQFSTNIVDAASQISGLPLSVQPGFCQGEAFGQVYHPEPADYPLKIIGVDLFLAAPPNGGVDSAHAQVEFWYGNSGSATPPVAEPDFVVGTDELFDSTTGEFGMPLEGNAAMQLDFDWNDPEGHPPLLAEGSFRVVVRFQGPSTDLQAEWGTSQCSLQPDLGMGGCQPVGVIFDQATTPEANLLHIYWPPSTCEPEEMEWHFGEDLGVTGDAVIRVRAEVGGQ